MIAKMRNDGLIAIRRRDVEVLDLARLKNLAEGIE